VREARAARAHPEEPEARAEPGARAAGAANW
jgi:hypothetical protein